MEDNKRKLYDALSQEYELGSFDQFCNDIADDTKRRKLYDATINEYDFGDFDSFSSQLGFSAKSAQTAPEAPKKAAVPATPAEAPAPAVEPEGVPEPAETKPAAETERKISFDDEPEVPAYASVDKTKSYMWNKGKMNDPAKSMVTPRMESVQNGAEKVSDAERVAMSAKAAQSVADIRSVSERVGEMGVGNPADLVSDAYKDNAEKIFSIAADKRTPTTDNLSRSEDFAQRQKAYNERAQMYDDLAELGGISDMVDKAKTDKKEADKRENKDKQNFYQGQLEDVVKRLDSNPQWRALVEAADAKMQDVEERITDQYSKYLKYHENDIKSSGWSGSLAGYRDENTTYFEAASRMLNEARRINNAPMQGAGEKGDGTKFRNFWIGQADDIKKPEWWSMGLTGIVDDASLLAVAKKIESLGSTVGKAKKEIDLDKELTPAERAVLDAYLEIQSARARRVYDTSKAYQSGEMAAESYKFMLQMMMTAPLGGALGDVALNAVEKYARKAGIKFLMKGAEKAAEKGVKEAARAFGSKYLKSIPRDIVGSVASFAQPALGANLLDQAATFNDDGTVKGFTPDVVGKALYSTWKEYFTEQRGFIFQDVTGIPLAWAAGKVASSNAGDLFKKMTKSLMGREFENITFFNGMGEVFEELEGAVMDKVFLGDDEQLSEFFGKDQFWGMIASFAPMFGAQFVSKLAMAGVSVPMEFRNKDKYMSRISDAFDRTQGYVDADYLNKFSNGHSISSEFSIKSLSDDCRDLVNEYFRSTNADGTPLTDKQKADFVRLVDNYYKAAVEDAAGNSYVEAQKEQRREQAISNEMRKLGGREFWNDIDGNSLVLRYQLPDEEQVYITGNLEGKENEYAAIGSDGRLVFIPKDVLDNNLDRLTENTLDGYIDTLIAVEDANKDNAERIEKQYVNYEELQQRFNSMLDSEYAYTDPSGAEQRIVITGVEPDGVYDENQAFHSWEELGESPADVMTEKDRQAAAVASMQAEDDAIDTIKDAIDVAIGNGIVLNGGYRVSGVIRSTIDPEKQEAVFIINDGKGRTSKVRISYADYVNADSASVAEDASPFTSAPSSQDASEPADVAQQDAGAGEGVVVDVSDVQAGATNEAEVPSSDTEVIAEGGDEATEVDPMAIPEEFIGKDGEVDYAGLLDANPDIFYYNYANVMSRDEALEEMRERVKELESSLKKTKDINKKPRIKATINRISEAIDRHLFIEDNGKKESGETTNLGEARKKKAEEAIAQAEAGRPRMIARWQNAEKVEGNEDAITNADGEVIEGRWMLVPVTSITPSHDPNNNFKVSEGATLDENGKTINDRDYEKDEEAQGEVMRIASDFDSRAWTNPIVVNKETGEVVSGNNRVMSAIIASQNGTNKKYLEHAKKYQKNRGFAEGSVESMGDGAIAVFVPNDDIEMNTQTFAKFNKRGEKAQSNTETAIKFGKTLSNDAIMMIADAIDKFEDINKAFADEGAVNDILDILVKDGAVSSMDLPSLKDGKKLSGQGRDLIEAALAGAVLKEEALRIAMADQDIRKPIISALKQIIVIRSKPGYDLSEEITDAIILVDRAKKNGVKIDEPISDYLTQPDIEGFESDDKVYEKIVQILAESINKKAYTTLKKVLSSYAQRIETGANLFDSDKEATLESLIKDILGYDIKITNNEGAEEAAADQPEGGDEAGPAVSVEEGSGEAGAEEVAGGAAEAEPVVETETPAAETPAVEAPAVEGGNEAPVNEPVEETNGGEPTLFGAAEAETPKTETKPKAETPKETKPSKKAETRDEAQAVFERLYGNGDPRVAKAMRVWDLTHKTKNASAPADNGVNKMALISADYGLTDEEQNEIQTLGVQLGVDFVNEGKMKFKDFFETMVDAFGDGIRPFTKGIYLGIGGYVTDEIADQMDDRATVRAFDENYNFNDDNNEDNGSDNVREPDDASTGEVEDGGSEGDAPETQGVLPAETDGEFTGGLFDNEESGSESPVGGQPGNGVEAGRSSDGVSSTSGKNGGRGRGRGGRRGSGNNTGGRKGTDEQPGESVGDSGVGRDVAVETEEEKAAKAESASYASSVEKYKDETNKDSLKQRKAQLEKDLAKYDGEADLVNAAKCRGELNAINERLRLLFSQKDEVKVDLQQEKIPYVSPSDPDGKHGIEGTVIPSGIAEDVYSAIKRIEQENGKSIAEFTREELGYKSIDEMMTNADGSKNTGLASPQVDSVGMAISQMKKKKMFIIGDMTGVGKGRQGAAIIRWAKRNNKKVLFVTEKSDLFSAMYADLADIGTNDLAPFVINNDTKATITDDEGKVLVRGLSENEKEKTFKTAGEMPLMRQLKKDKSKPKPYDFVMMTYSQAQSAENDNSKSKDKLDWVKAYAKDAIVILDESHNAAGASARGKFFRDIVTDAEGVVFMSATYAKRPDSMALYSIRSSMSEATISTEELIGAVADYGIPMQEALAASLFKTGEMIRRERDFTDVKTHWVDPSETYTEEERKAARSTVDKTVDVINDMIFFQEDVKVAVDKINKDQFKENNAAVKKSGDGVTYLYKLHPYSSQMSNLMNLLTTGLKVKNAAKLAIEQIKKGEKPVIALDNTLASYIDDEEDVLDAANFSTVVRKGLPRLMNISLVAQTYKDGKKVSEKDGGVNVQHLSLDEVFGLVGFMNEYEDLKGLISYNENNGLWDEIPLSPIDYIIGEIEKAGYSCGEITGREYKLVKGADGKFTKERRTANKKEVMRRFNGGTKAQPLPKDETYDALILNTSGATGISLHASKKFGDRRKRDMIILQPARDVNTEVQIRGRIDRTNQEHRGEYFYIISPIPAERKSIMMLRQKLASLDANSVGTEDVSSNKVNVDDMDNQYGDEVAFEYLSKNTNVNTKLNRLGGKGAEVDKFGNLKMRDDLFYDVLLGLQRMSADEQDAILDELQNLYAEKIEFLNQNGVNPLKSQRMDLEAETIDKAVLVAGKDNESLSEFLHDTFIERVKVKALKKSLRSSDINKRMETLGAFNEDGTISTRYGQDYYYKVSDASDKIYADREKKYQEQEDAVLAKLREQHPKKEGQTDEEYENSFYQYPAYTDLRAKHQEELKRLKDDLAEQKRIVADIAFDFIPGQPVEINLTDDINSPTGFGRFIGYTSKNYTPRSTKAVFATKDSRAIVEIPVVSQSNILTRIYTMSLRNEDIKAVGRNLDDMAGTKAKWDEWWDKQMSRSTGKQIRYMVTGNVVQASGKLGKYKGTVSIFSRKDKDTGEITHERGMLLANDFDPENLIIKERVFKNDVWESSNGFYDKDHNMDVMREGNKLVVMFHPRTYVDKKGAGHTEPLSKHPVRNDSRLIELSNDGEFHYSGRDTIFIYINEDKAEDALTHLYKEYGFCRSKLFIMPDSTEKPDAIIYTGKPYKEVIDELAPKYGVFSSYGTEIEMKKRLRRYKMDLDNEELKAQIRELSQLYQAYLREDYASYGDLELSWGAIIENEAMDDAAKSENKDLRETHYRRREAMYEELDARGIKGFKRHEKQGEVSYDYITKLFDELNEDKDNAEFAKRIFGKLKSANIPIFFDEKAKSEDNSGVSQGMHIRYNWKFFNDDHIGNATKAETILHELTHTVTEYMIFAIDTYNEHLISKDVMNDIDYLGAIRPILRRHIDLFKENNAAYALKNTSELLAEFASNPKVREATKKVKVIARSRFGTLSFAEFKEGDDANGGNVMTAYDAINEIFTDMLNSYNAEAQKELYRGTRFGAASYHSLVVDEAEKNSILARGIYSGEVGIAPNGARSRLNDEEWAAVRTDDFISQFGDWRKDGYNGFVALDINGEPDVVDGKVLVRNVIPSTGRTLDDVEPVVHEGEAAIKKSVNKVADALGAEVVFEDKSKLSGRKANSYGWYAPDGTVHIVVDNIPNTEVAQAKAIHEIVAHKGLRTLLTQEEIDAMAKELYDNATADVKKAIDKIMKTRTRSGENRAKSITDAVEEYLADICETGSLSIGEETLWQKFRNWLVEKLRRFGLNIRYTEEDIRHIGYSIFRRMKDGGSKNLVEKAQELISDNALLRAAVASHEPSGNNTPGGNNGGGNRFSSKNSVVTEEQDAEYMDTVKAGDMDKAQQMVNEVADSYLSRKLLPDDKEEVGYKYHRGATPSKIRTMYAVFNVSPDGFHAAYAGNNSATPVGVWLDAQNLKSYESSTVAFDDGTPATYIPGDTGKSTKAAGINPESRGPEAIGKNWLLERGGKHGSDVPNFSQMNLGVDENGEKVSSKSNGALPHNKLVFEIECGMSEDGDLTEFVKENGRMMRGKNQGLKGVQPNQFYFFKTNPNAKGNWGIAGTFRIKRLVPYDEIVEKSKEAGIPVQKWVGGYHPEDSGLTVEAVDEMYQEGKNKKLLDAVTYDDNGNVIPLSARFNDMSNDIRYSSLPSRTAAEREKLFSDAVNEYGTTEDFREAGYMLPNGDMLDFSEKKDGGEPGRRSQDHRNIGVIMDYASDSPSRYMFDFMNEGAIRMLPEHGGICIMRPLTSGQKMILRRYFRKHSGEVIVDIINDRGYTEGYKEFDKGTDSDAIFYAIEDHFRGSKLGEEDEYTRYSDLEDNEDDLSSDPTRFIEMDEYRFAANNWLNRIKEQQFDETIPVRKAQEVIQKRLNDLDVDKPMGRSENVADIMQHAPSKYDVEHKKFVSEFLKPILNVIARIKSENKDKIGDGEITQYLCLKNGLERQIVFAQRDAREAVKNKRETALNSEDRKHKENLKAIDKLADKADAEKKAAKEKERHEQAIDKINTYYDEQVERIDMKDETQSDYKKFREKEYGAIRAWFAEYYDENGNKVDRLPSWDPAIESEASYAERVKKMTRLPDGFDDIKYAEEKAQEWVADFEQRAMESIDLSVEGFWNTIRRATDYNVRLQFEHHLISRAQMEGLIGDADGNGRQFEYYVPMRGFADETAEDRFDYAYDGKNGRSSYVRPFIKAGGRITKPESPIAYIATIHDSAAASAFKNDAGVALYRYVMRRPEQKLITISKTWFVKEEGTEDGKEKWEPAYPDYSGCVRESDFVKADKVFAEKMDELKKEGRAKESSMELDLHNTVIDKTAEKSQHVVLVKYLGKEYSIIFNGDPRAAQMMNGMLRNPKLNSGIWHAALRWLARTNTSLRPAFWITNFQRDAIFSITNYATNHDAKHQRRFAANILHALRVLPLYLSEGEGFKKNGGDVKDRYYRMMFNEYMRYGGPTGQTVVNSREAYQKITDKYIKRMSSAGGELVEVGADILRKGLDVGEAIEQVWRFAAYMTARELDKDKGIEHAISEAKTVTLNFGQKGSSKYFTWEDTANMYRGNIRLGANTDPFNNAVNLITRLFIMCANVMPALRNVVLFYNAIMQGIYTTAKNFKHHPAKASTIALLMMSAGAVTALHRRGDDDEDWSTQSDYRRHNKLQVRAGRNKDLFLLWGLPQEYAPLFALGDNIVRRAQHKQTTGEVLKDAAVDFLALLPMNPLDMAAPAPLQALWENYNNENYQGYPISRRNMWNDNKPSFLMANNNTWQWLVDMDETLNRWAEGNTYKRSWLDELGDLNLLDPSMQQNVIESIGGGMLKDALSIINIGSKIYRGEDLEMRDFPAISRIVYDTKDPWTEATTREHYDHYHKKVERVKKSLSQNKDNATALDIIMKDEDYQYYLLYLKYKDALDANQELFKAKTDRKENTASKKETLRERDDIRKVWLKECIEYDILNKLGKD